MTAQQRHLFTRRWHNVVEQQSETKFHIQLVEILNWCIRPDVYFRHVPLGGLRDKREAAKLKAMGTKPGAADLEFHWHEIDELGRKIRRLFHLELKQPGRKPSDDQIAYALAMRLMGDEWAVAHSVDEAIEVLQAQGLLLPNVEVRRR